MAIVIVDGNEVEIGERRAAQRHSGRRAGRHRHSALLLAPGPVGRGQLPHVPGRDRHAQRRDRRDHDAAQAGARLPDAGHRQHGLRHQQREGEAEPGDGRGGPADRSPDRLPDLRQGGRVLLAGLSLRARPGRAAGRHPPVHQPPPRDGRHGHAVRRSLRDVQPLRALHARDQRHQPN